MSRDCPLWASDGDTTSLAPVYDEAYEFEAPKFFDLGSICLEGTAEDDSSNSYDDSGWFEFAHELHESTRPKKPLRCARSWVLPSLSLPLVRVLGPCCDILESFRACARTQVAAQPVEVSAAAEGVQSGELVRSAPTPARTRPTHTKTRSARCCPLPTSE